MQKAGCAGEDILRKAAQGIWGRWEGTAWATQAGSGGEGESRGRDGWPAVAAYNLRIQPRHPSQSPGLPAPEGKQTQATSWFKSFDWGEGGIPLRLLRNEVRTKARGFGCTNPPMCTRPRMTDAEALQSAEIRGSHAGPRAPGGPRLSAQPPPPGTVSRTRSRAQLLRAPRPPGQEPLPALAADLSAGAGTPGPV